MLQWLRPGSCGGFPMWMLSTRYPGSPTAGTLPQNMASYTWNYLRPVSSFSSSMYISSLAITITDPYIPNTGVGTVFNDKLRKTSRGDDVICKPNFLYRRSDDTGFFKECSCRTSFANEIRWAYPFLIMNNTDYMPYPQSISVAIQI